MHVDVVKLVSESGELLRVTGVLTGDGRYSALQLEFASGVLQLRCDEDSDEIIVEIGARTSGYPTLRSSSVTELIGMRIDSAWSLTNHRGYVDAFQLRFTDNGDQEETRQFEVGASAMDIWRVE